MKKINDAKIESFLDALGEEYKEMLLKELIEESDSLETLSISRLVSIDADIKRYLAKKKENKKIRRLQVYGILYLLLGLLLIFMSEIISNFRDLSYLAPEEMLQLISLTMCLAGALIMFIPMFVTSNKRIQRSKSQQKLIEYEVIVTWKELEAMCADLLPKEKMIHNRSIIQLLSQEMLLDDEEEKDLLSFLKIRNSVIHSSNNKPTEEEMRLGIKRANRIIANIYKKMRPTA